MTKSVMFYKVDTINNEPGGTLAVPGENGWMFEDAKLVTDDMTNEQIGAYVRSALTEDDTADGGA